MVTKKQKRTEAVRHKKTKKKRRLLMLSAIVVIAVVFLAIFFITLFDYLYPPAAGKRPAQKRDKQEVTLYFSDAQERFLVPEKRFVPKEKAPEAQATEIVRALIAGSKSGLVNTFPDKAELKAVRFEGKETLLVDFQESLVTHHPGGSAAEMATVHSLTNSLAANIPAVKKVKILIDGQVRETLKGHVGLKHSFSVNRELIVPAAPPKEG
jgi:spore germination protein GerM